MVLEIIKQRKFEKNILSNDWKLLFYFFLSYTHCKACTDELDSGEF